VIRFRMVIKVAIFAVVVALSGSIASAQTAAPLTEVLYGVLGPSASEWPLYIARDQGFFRDQGLTLTIVAGGSPTNVAQAIATGAVNIASDGTDAIIAGVAHGLSMKIVGSTFTTMPYQVITIPSITTWAQLKGSTIALGPKKGGVAAMAFYRMIGTHHLKESDFELLGGGSSSARYAALISGNVRAALLSQPFDILAESKGMRVLASGSDYLKNWVFTVAAVNTAWAATNRLVIVGFLRALRMGVAYGYSHRDSAISTLVAATNVSKTVAEQTYDLDFVKWHAFDRNLDVPRTALQNVGDVMIEQGSLAKLPSMSDIFDPSYSAEAGH